MRLRGWLLAGFSTVASSLHLSASVLPLSARVPESRHLCRTDPSTIECSSNPDLVVQQAKEIASLRRQLEQLQGERDDQQSARTPKRRGRPPKRAPGTPRTPVYKLYGKLTEGFDAAPIERLIARRVVARLKKHYSEADRLQSRILRMGVKLDDRLRTWSLRRGWKESQEALAAEDAQMGRQQQRLQAEVEEMVKRLFHYWDQDGNGLIDRTEFRLALQILNVPDSSAASYDETFDAWDTDGNGGLNFKEIRSALLELQRAHGPEVLSGADQTAYFLGAEGPVAATVREDFGVERASAAAPRPDDA